ncbi:MAG: hypothetical protein KJ621_10345 [Proteobacteria bacterium]|nr:hypothetical protein [Pseudomonadota bacterium]MBU1740936.1 hypothetical protein [Pseudomonadota bacterium]
MIRSPFRVVTLVLMSLALAAWYDCLTTTQYDRIKHTPQKIVEPRVQSWPVILRPGGRVCVSDVVPVKTFCLEGFPPGREVCVSGTIHGRKGLILEVFHDGGSTSLGVRLGGQDLYWLHGHHFFMPGPVPVTGSRLCLTNRDVYTITVTGLEVRNHSGYNSGFPRFYFVPRNLLPVRLNFKRFGLSAAGWLVALVLWWFVSYRLVVRLGLLDQVTPVFLISLAPLLYVIPTSLGAIFLSTDRILFVRTEVVLIAAGLVVIPQVAATLIFKLVAVGRGRRSA